jgi:hypothetical protein
MGTPAGQYIPPARSTGASRPRGRPALKPVVAGKPNPNIGQGLKTYSDLPQFGEVGWVNPNFDLYHNADGYHRFDPKIVGMGMQMSRTYADGAAAYDIYQGLAQGAPGSSLAKDALQFMTDNGLDPARATDVQKFAAMDYAGRHVQWKNQRPKRKFGIKDAFGLALSVGAIFAGNPYLAAAMAGGGTALQGGDLGDIALSAGMAGFSSGGGGPLVTAGKLGMAGYQSLASSGVNLSPTAYSNLQGGNEELTTFESENENIHTGYSSAHPTSAYTGAYPGIADAGARPINTTPIAPINRTMAAAKPYVAPPRVQIAPNIPIINYDPRRNYQSPTTMQQALTRPAATRAPSKNARTA